MLPLVALISIPVNLLTLLLFALDKSRASRRKGQRVPESTLLLCAALGGTPGAYLGRWLLRHKTRKQPFVARLDAIALAQAALLGLAFARGWLA